MTGSNPPSIIAVSGANPRMGARGVCALREQAEAREARRLMLGISALVAGLVAWSAVAEVDELARARGTVEPVGRVQSVQSEQGGTLAELLVRRDDAVAKVQVIARFDSTEIRRDLDQSEVRLASLRIEMEMLDALIARREPDFSIFSSYPKLVAAAWSLLNEKINQLDARLAGKASELEGRQGMLDSLTEQIPSVMTETEAVNEVYERMLRGAHQGVVSNVRLAEARERAAAADQRLRDIQGRRIEAEKLVSAVRSELDGVRNDFVTQARAEHTDLVEKARELELEVKALRARLASIEVVAPVAGIIQHVPDARSGAVIAAGGVVADIVPTDGALEMEASVLPRDIGFVRVGQSATIKVDAFDFSRFGSVPGRIKSISPTAEADERSGQPFYRIILTLDADHVGTRNDQRLLPGMTGEADIVTGRKSVFQYLLKPVFVGADTAFHER